MNDIIAVDVTHLYPEVRKAEIPYYKVNLFC